MIPTMKRTVHTPDTERRTGTRRTSAPRTSTRRVVETADGSRDSGEDADTTRRDVLRGLGAVAGAGVLAGCGSVTGESPEARFRYAQVLSPLALDPILVDDYWSAQATSLVFEGLYAYDDDLSLVPVLADGPPTVEDGGRTYRVRLADGARFQDGTGVSPEDVKYSFEAPVREDAPTRWSVDVIESVATPDERTVEFSLASPYPAFEHSLTRGVVPKTVREDNPAAFARESPIGSGPYEVDVYKPGSYVTFTAWEDYWGAGGPTVDRVEFVPNHAGLSRSMSLRTRRNDLVERVQPKLWGATEDMPNARVASTPGFHSVYLGFNCTGGPTADPKVREAVDYLATLDEFTKHAVEPAGVRQYGPFPDRIAKSWGMPLGEWKGIPHRKSVEKAKTLFEAAGVSSWTPTVAVPGTKSSGDKMREKLAEEIVHGLKEAGFRRARTEKYSWERFRETVTSGNRREYAMFVGSWAGAPDPDAFLYPLVHENMQGLTNGTYYNRQSVMERISAARRTRNRDRRRRLYARAATTLLEDRAIVPAFTLHNSFGVRDNVHGFDPHPVGGANPDLAGEDGLTLRE